MKHVAALPHLRSVSVARFVAYAVGLNGLAIIAQPIILALLQHQHVHIKLSSAIIFDAQLVAAMGLLYLSVLLYRGKRTAWLFTCCVYAVIFALNIWRYIDSDGVHFYLHPDLFTSVIAPALIVVALVLSRRAFTVKSDIASFTLSLRISILVLSVALVYGVSGFIVMDRHDFHKEITITEAIHRTIDQFDLTTNTSLEPHTRRAHIFMDSLSILSTASLVYVFVSLFQPLKSRFTDQTHQRKQLLALLQRYPGSSEDFFKLWPHDKLYFLNAAHTAALAYSAHKRAALVVGDPAGDPKAFDTLLEEFLIFCRTNDWSPAFVHTDPRFTKLYKRHGFALQKIGEEAVVSIKDFLAGEATNKYFRQIRNKFTKQGYSVEIVQPPHSPMLAADLRHISDNWLARPGRKERRFMMGYFTAKYLQQGPVAVLKDSTGQIQGFINQIPSFDAKEANFDMLRQSDAAPGNSSDFMLLEFIKYLDTQGFERINLGLCPLAGLDTQDEANSVTNNALRFLYANGDRFYSFNGLKRFKAKYNPQWQSRYIAYRGGIRGFTQIMAALNRAMKLD
jgi:phosphatidylglycerol lysyltransferase